MKSAITSLAYALPENVLKNTELELRFGKDVMKKIEKVSGILERRIVDNNICTSDLAFEAAQLIFKNTQTSPDDFDLLIFATQTPDYLLPTTACIMQERLKMSKKCAAFDINLGCSQFIYAVATAKAWIENGLAKKALILAGDTPTKLIHKNDKSAVALFGDAAIACVVEPSKKGSFVDFVFGTDGSGFQDLIAPTSGFRHRPNEEDSIEFEDENQNIRTNNNLYINGFKIFTFAYKIVAESVELLLKRNKLSVDDIDLFVFHQAGEMIVNSSAKRLNIPANKIYYKMHDIGNCGGASVAIALADAVQNNKLKAGDKVVVCAFGVGLSWGASLIEWSSDFKGAYTLADFSKSAPKPLSQSAI